MNTGGILAPPILAGIQERQQQVQIAELARNNYVAGVWAVLGIDDKANDVQIDLATGTYTVTPKGAVNGGQGITAAEQQQQPEQPELHE